MLTLSLRRISILYHSYFALIFIYLNSTLEYYLSRLLSFLIPPLNFAPKMSAPFKISFSI